MPPLRITPKDLEWSHRDKEKSIEISIFVNSYKSSKSIPELQARQ